MAPLPITMNIPDLSISSLELDSRSSLNSVLDLPAYLSSLSLSEREAFNNPSSPLSDPNLAPRDISNISPLEAHSILASRDTASLDPGAGSVSPDAINMKAVQAIFALIGAGFVLGSIWFFFWAKNGGFQWRKGDWEDYKSTVLRRKGPNGTTLSNATKSTRLGGGSVVGSGYSDSTSGGMTELSSEAPIIREKRGKKGKKHRVDKAPSSAPSEAPPPPRESAKEKKLREAKEARWEGGADEDVRAYRHERVARVGGLNRDSDAQFYGTDYSETAPSVTIGHAPRRPRQSSSRQGSRQSSRQTSRQASPEKKGRADSRRDFSYGRQDDNFTTTGTGVHDQTTRPPRYHSPTKGSGTRASKHSASASYTEPLDFTNDAQSQGTKTYHHPLPELSKSNGGGFRRGRRDSLDDSD